MSRLTVAQALVRFLGAQEVERDAERSQFFAGCFGILGHGNLAGLGQALQQYGDLLPYHMARNEQAMVRRGWGVAGDRSGHANPVSPPGQPTTISPRYGLVDLRQR